MKNFKLCDESKCTLCKACVNICPKNAIELSLNQNGYEKLDINSDLCINCGLCSKVCALRDEVNTNSPIACFAAQATDNEKLKLSASGGVFQVLARYVLEKGGVCYGSEGKLENGKYTAAHTRIDSVDELYRILNTKYVPSNADGIYKEAKADLEDGKLVLFCSVPCQIQGFKAFLGREYENLLTADLICHGITSIDLFNNYLDELERRDNITITDFQFRDKSVSWGTNFCYSYYKNNHSSKRIKVRHLPREASSYITNFLKGNICRENCYSCSLSNGKRVGDFTLGDYWSIEAEYPEFITSTKPAISLRRGVSCILANTTKAMEYIRNISSQMILHEVTFEAIANHNSNLITSSRRGRERDKILELYREKGYCAVEERYREKVGKKKIVYNIKNVLKSRLPDRARILIYKTPFLKKFFFR